MALSDEATTDPASSLHEALAVKEKPNVPVGTFDCDDGHAELLRCSRDLRKCSSEFSMMLFGTPRGETPQTWPLFLSLSRITDHHLSEASSRNHVVMRLLSFTRLVRGVVSN